MTSPTQPARSASVPVIGILWFLAAAFVAATGRLETLKPPAPQLMVLGLTVLLLATILLVSPVSRWVGGLPARAIVAFHLIRLVAGSGFLLFYMRGELPAAFAIPSGWGDITVAVLAAVLLVIGPPATEGRRRLYFIWNLLGLADILFVVVTAASVGVSNPAGMTPLLRLPLSLLPTFFVPLIIVSHFVLALRLKSRGQPS